MRSRDDQVVCFGCNSHFVKNGDGMLIVSYHKIDYHIEGGRNKDGLHSTNHSS